VATAQLQAQIKAIPWYHEFDFGNGLKAESNTPDIDGHRRIWDFIRARLDTIDFADKTVLDVGCWDGYWSFYAEQRGAKHVLATDDFSQNWSNSDGLSLAKNLLGSNIEIDTRVSTYKLASMARRFDIVLFLGVYYHLVDPLYALAQLRHCCRPGTVVVVEGNEGVALPKNSAAFDAGNGTSKFLPSASHMREILKSCYFKIQSEDAMPLAPEAARLGWRWRLRTCWEALCGSREGLAHQVQEANAVRRRIFTCTPFEGENSSHFYAPPFGLAAYDSRFK